MTKQETIDLMQKIALDVENNPEVRYQTWIIFFINEVYRQIVEPLKAEVSYVKNRKEQHNDLKVYLNSLEEGDNITVTADFLDAMVKAEAELANYKQMLLEAKSGRNVGKILVAKAVAYDEVSKELCVVKEELENTKLAYETQAVELGKLYDKYDLLQDQMKLQVAEASKLKKSLADEQMANGYYDALCQKNDELSRELAVYKCALKIASKEHMYLEILFEQTWLEQARKELKRKK